MSKEPKPTLGTGAPRQRKRNIQTKLDPESFRTRIIEILMSPREDDTGMLQQLSSDTLDYSRYGEVFCEVLLAGNIVQPGGALRDKPTQCCVFLAQTDAEADRWVRTIHQMVRRKPFLRTRLDEVVGKLLLCLSAFGVQEQVNLAKAVALMLNRAMLSPGVLKKLMMDGTIEAGLSLKFVTVLIQSYLDREVQDTGANEVGAVQVDKLMGVLKSAGIDTGTMVRMMPAKRRSAAGLSEHFSNLGLSKLVERNERRIKEEKIAKVRDGIAEWVIGTGTNAGCSQTEMVLWVDQTREEVGLSSKEMVVAVWDGVVSGVSLGRKGVENRKAVLRFVGKASDVLMAVCKGGNEEIELIRRIQSFVSADMELLKVGVFRDVVYTLYEKDVLSEDTILRWYRRGSRLTKGSAASSNIIREQMAPFVKWLETAEEEKDED